MTKSEAAAPKWMTWAGFVRTPSIEVRMKVQTRLPSAGSSPSSLRSDLRFPYSP
jgi:hypothetical protein